MKLYLIDAYALIFRAYYAFIRAPRINSKGINTSAIMGFFNTLEEVINEGQPTHIGVAFDPAGGSFRSQIYPLYKAQREETPEAIRQAVPYIKQALQAYRIPVIEVPGYEADDVIGTLATQAGKQGIDTYMLTPDKDYGQLVTNNVRMLKPRNGQSGFDILGPSEICEKWGLQSPLQVIDMLGLMGDTADNIPGCKGVGEKTAATLIQQWGSIDNLLANTEQLKGALRTKVETSREDILLSRHLAEIVTNVPVTLDLEALTLQDPDREALTSLFEDLELRTLLRRKFGDASSIAVSETSGLSAATKTSQTAASGTSRTSSGSASGGFPAGKSASKDPFQLDLFAEPEPQAAAEPQTSPFLPSAGTSPVAPSSAASPSADVSVFGSIATDNPSYHLISSPEARRDLLARLLAASEVSLDTETTSTSPLEAELVGLSFAIEEKEAFYVPIPANRTEAQAIVEEFRPLYESTSITKIGQNLKYDLNVLANYGIRLAAPHWDTMIAHYVLQPELHHGMDYLSEVYLNYKTIPITALIGEDRRTQRSMRDVPPEEVCPYAAEDADITLRLKHRFQPMLETEGSLSLFTDIEMPLMPVLADMERHGVRLDTDALRQAGSGFADRLTELEQEIHALAGREFNISSPSQVGVVLFEDLHLLAKPKKTRTGQYVTSEEVLTGIRSKHPIVEKILEHRGIKKLLSTYIDKLPELINQSTGHIHTSFNQTVTATGRLSSSNPNLQNIPVRGEAGKEIRKAFVPEPGELFFSADYSQIELRIMAHLSGDEHLISAFREGHDIHAATAARIFKKDITDVSRDERRKAKTANFGIIYGISAFGLAERLDVSRTEAKALIDSYFETYPRVHQYMQESIDRARELGYTETVLHRRCYLRDINSHNAVVRGYAERNAINAPIQGSAADIIKIAMARIHRRFEAESLRARMILQVHDELNFSVPAEERDRVEAIVIEEMQNAFQMSVPLIADCGWGANWLEAH